LEEKKRMKKIISTTRYPDRNQLIYSFSFGAGLRACEISALLVKDVLTSENEIKDTVYLDQWQTKGNKRQSIVVSQRLQKEIQQYFAKFPYLTKDREGRLFRTQSRKGFSSQTIQELFRNLYRDANIDNASSHSGRRQFITSLSENGTSVRIIQALARHSNLATTARYIDISNEKLRNAVDLVGI
jgi:integrase/recombinase XerD